MNDDVFERRVRAAAVAGWWTLLAAAELPPPGCPPKFEPQADTVPQRSRT